MEAAQKSGDRSEARGAQNLGTLFGGGKRGSVAIDQLKPFVRHLRRASGPTQRGENGIAGLMVSKAGRHTVTVD